MVVTSLKGMPEIRLGNIFSPPMEITFEPWVKAWATACTGLQLRRSLAGASGTRCASPCPRSILSIAIASVNGYALANWRFKGAEPLLRHPDLRRLHSLPGDDLSDRHHAAGRSASTATLTGLIIVHSIFGMPILTLLFRNYFASLPEELFKAARVDGAGFWGIYLPHHAADEHCRSSWSPSSCRSPASGTTSCSASSTPAATPIR